MLKKGDSIWGAGFTVFTDQVIFFHVLKWQMDTGPELYKIL